MKELAPTGKLRVALVFAPEKSIFFVVKDVNGKPHGVTADIAMVTAALPARTIEEVDRAGVRVIGIANTTTIRAATRTLKNASVSPVASVAEAVAMLRDGKADAFALSRDSLPTYVKQVPGSRITDGAFQQIGVAIAVAKSNPAALAAVTEFMDDAKKNGAVRKALDDTGFADIAVAPMSPTKQQRF